MRTSTLGCLVSSAVLASLAVACSAAPEDDSLGSSQQAASASSGGTTTTGGGGGGYTSDGHADIFWKHGSGVAYASASANASNEISLWHYEPGGNTEMRAIDAGTMAAGLTEVAEGDFWGDNSKGVLLCGYVTHDCSAWKMLGGAIIGNAHVGAIGATWMFAGTYDLDGDGRKDIVWMDQSTGVHVWFMNGPSYRQVDSNSVTLRNPVGVGKLDGVNPYLVELDNQNVMRAVRIASNGTLVGGEQYVSPQQSPWYVIPGVGDADGDGKADLFWRNTQTGQVGAWLMNGTSARAYPILGTASLAWNALNVDDYDGDGRVDLLWRDGQSEQVSIWFANPNMTLRDTSIIGSTDCTWALDLRGYYVTTLCPVAPPPPPPKCAAHGQPVTSAGCCDSNDQAWGGLCETKDPDGCGVLDLGVARPCCFHRATQCDTGATCGKMPGGSYRCYANGNGTTSCGSAPALTCSIDCGNGPIASGQYCSQQDANTAVTPCQATCP